MTKANSTAAEPRRLRRNRRNIFLAVAVEPAGDGIKESLNRQRLSARKNYPKVIVEVFRRIRSGAIRFVNPVLTIFGVRPVRTRKIDSPDEET
jgi:hypothetical protein